MHNVCKFLDIESVRPFIVVEDTTGKINACAARVHICSCIRIRNESRLKLLAGSICVGNFKLTNIE
jgi:hypothetical protein